MVSLDNSVGHYQPRRLALNGKCLVELQTAHANPQLFEIRILGLLHVLLGKGPNTRLRPSERHALKSLQTFQGTIPLLPVHNNLFQVQVAADPHPLHPVPLGLGLGLDLQLALEHLVVGLEPGEARALPHGEHAARLALRPRAAHAAIRGCFPLLRRRGLRFWLRKHFLRGRGEVFEEGGVGLEVGASALLKGRERVIGLGRHYRSLVGGQLCELEATRPK
jgi:hypothetical protein